MGKTKRRDPYAHALESPLFRGRRMQRDKRKAILEKLANEAAEVPEDWGHGVRSSPSEGAEEREGSPAVGSTRSNNEHDPSQERDET